MKTAQKLYNYCNPDTDQEEMMLLAEKEARTILSWEGTKVFVFHDDSSLLFKTKRIITEIAVDDSILPKENTK